MNNFSYVWFFSLFILQVVTVGISLGKLGEEKKTKYSFGFLLVSILIALTSGLSIYFWPN